MHTTIDIVTGRYHLWGLTAPLEGCAWVAPPLAVALGIAWACRRSSRARARRQERLEFLYDCAQLIHGPGDVESVLRSLLRHACATLRARAGAIVVFARAGGALRTSVGPGDASEAMVPVRLDPGTLLRFARDGRASRIACAPDLGWMLPHEFGRAIAVPLQGDTGIHGVAVVADRPGEVSAFDDDDVRLLETIAGQVGVWLENGRLEQSLAQVTELKEQLRHQAFHDPLTGLANRALFSDRVEQAVARAERSDPSFAVLFVDLDDFKTTNDVMGHEAGDRLLVQVGRRILECLRPMDTAARLGGDEFALLLEGTDEPHAARVAARLLSSLSEPFRLDEREVIVGASIGIAVAGPGWEASAVLGNADMAMYAAKARGKHRYQVFHPSMRDALTSRMETSNDLREAIEHGQLRLRYQPIVAIRTGEVVGAEALVRWAHPRRGLTPPFEFVPLAEESGAIREIGRWVMREAARQAREWRQARPSFTVAVNVSARQLEDTAFVDEVRAALEDAGCPPESVVLEITEGTMMRDFESNVAVAAALGDLGVRLALDDFGTGYSSLRSLRSLPVDIVKIDRSFVAAMDSGSEADARFMRLLVHLIDGLGLHSLAEGVESESQWRQLSAMGCALGQGFHYSRPVSGRDLGGLLESGRQPELRALRTEEPVEAAS